MLSFRAIRRALGIALIIVLAGCQPVPTATPAPTDLPVPVLDTLREGRPVQSPRPKDPRVYLLLQDGRVHLFADYPAYEALGFQPQDLWPNTVDPLRHYPPGTSLTRWLTGVHDRGLYFMYKSRRYPIHDRLTLEATGGSPTQVTQVPDTFLHQYPLSPDPIPEIDGITAVYRAQRGVTTTAAVWAGSRLWVARSNDLLRGWRPPLETSETLELTALVGLTTDGQHIWGATIDGTLWQIDPGMVAVEGYQQIGRGGVITAIAALNNAVWYADVGHYDVNAHAYATGRGLVRRGQDGNEQIFTLEPTNHDPLKNITTLAAYGERLWIGTRHAGVLVYTPTERRWQRFDMGNSALPDNGINTLYPSSDGSVWIATKAGVARLRDGKIDVFPMPEDRIVKEPLALTVDGQGVVWAAGAQFIARLGTDGEWTVETAFDQAGPMDRFGSAVTDESGVVWFVGDRTLTRRGGGAPASYAVDTGSLIPPAADLPAFNLPLPTADYRAYLDAWPRPEADNGRCIHYLAAPSEAPFELRLQISRLKQLGVRWLLVNYTSRSQLMAMAPAFAEAGLIVVWRPFERPYRVYPFWADDVKFLHGLGLPPYIQIYNEPSLGQEWEDAGKQVDQAVYMEHVIPAIRAVYEAGGFVGLQELRPEWVRDVLRRMKQEKLDGAFGRMFFVPHAYGYNRPPEHDATIDSALGFRDFARVFQDELGFVPMMIAGEGGWRPGEQQDKRFPMVTATLHRDYLLSVFDWFRTGKLSNGGLLPDYFFAFCPWILADPSDPAAWFDSMWGERYLVTSAVEALPAYTRRFTWQVAESTPENQP